MAGLTGMRIASPERWWRAATAPIIGGLLGWAGPPLAAAPTARIIATCLGVAVGLYLAVLITRTHLAVGIDGLADHRMFRVVRVPWQQISRFEVGRPGGLWGGFCIAAVRRDGTTVDLLSMRAYSRIPSARHLDELQRICWTLEEAAATQVD